MMTFNTKYFNMQTYRIKQKELFNMNDVSNQKFFERLERDIDNASTRIRDLNNAPDSIKQHFKEYLTGKRLTSECKLITYTEEPTLTFTFNQTHLEKRIETYHKKVIKQIISNLPY